MYKQDDNLIPNDQKDYEASGTLLIYLWVACPSFSVLCIFNTIKTSHSSLAHLFHQYSSIPTNNRCINFSGGLEIAALQQSTSIHLIASGHRDLKTLKKRFEV